MKSYRLVIRQQGRIVGHFDTTGEAALEDAFGRDIDLLPDVDVQPGSKVASEITKYGVMVYAGQ